MSAPLHPQEVLRLEALAETRLLDTEPEAAFDEICRLATIVCGTPTAFVSFVDGARQWFKARVNLEPHETPRAVSFCAYAILYDGGIVIPDATRDPRVRDNPLVTGPPFIRLYAGVPLLLGDRQPIGTLSVIDPRPRMPTPKQLEALRMLARQVVTQIEVRMQRARLVEANARLREREARLAGLVEELETFTRTVSHDIRAPLRAISGWLAMLGADLGDSVDPATRDLLDRADAASKRANALVEGVLALSRAGRASLDLHDIDLTAMAAEAVDDLRAACPARTVEVRIAPGLVARADPRLARVLLDNLLGNAFKFTAPRDVAHVEVGRTAAGEFFVRDDGVGFDPQEVDRLFRPFERLHGRAFEGSGVGLATVRRVVERHGGTVRAESAPGRGTTVYFTLPAPAPARVPEG